MLFESKQNKIMSRLRLRYSIQEKIINYLKDKTDSELIELSNVIFYGKNKLNKLCRGIY